MSARAQPATIEPAALRLHIRAILFVVSLICITSTEAYAQACPSNAWQEVQEHITLTTHTSMDHAFNPPLAPCESVFITIVCTSSCSGSPNMSLVLYTSSNVWLDGSYFLCGSSCSDAYIPGPSDAMIASGYAFPAMVGGTNWTPAYVEVGLGYGTSSIEVKLTINRMPRPGYNTGGTSISNAPMINVGDVQRGSLDGYGQFYKIHIGSGDSTYTTSTLISTTTYAPVFYVNLFDPNQNYIGAYYSTTTPGTVYLPPIGGSPSGHYWTNSGSAGDFYIQLVGLYGIVTDFTFALQAQTASGFSLTGTNTALSRISNSVLYSSTGDSSNYMTASPTPLSAFVNPAFTWPSPTNPNSNCVTTVTFAPAAGSGAVSSVMTATPTGTNCSNASGIFSVSATAMGLSSSNSMTAIVPPQVMIQMTSGEMQGQIADGDDSKTVALLVAKNRFGDNGFTGGQAARWQTVLVTSAFYNIDGTTFGRAPDIAAAAEVFAGLTNVSIPAGCKSYWSPTNSQWSVLLSWWSANAQSNWLADSDWQAMGAPWDVWRSDLTRQAVIKSTVANNVVASKNQAPALVMFCKGSSQTQPAFVTD